MSKIKNLDHKDVVFIDQLWTDEERKQFCLFKRHAKLKSLLSKK